MPAEMPRDLSEEAVAEWVGDLVECDEVRPSALRYTAQAFLALVRAKVREGVTAAAIAVGLKSGETTESIVSRVMGDHPQGGHEAEGREVRRG